MSTPDTRYAYFHVRGSFDPEEITRAVGVTPTETAREGSTIGQTSKARPCSLWSLHSRLERTAPLEQHVEDVLAQMDGNKAVFEKLSRELGGTMQLVGYFGECEPRVSLPPRTLERMAEYALVLDCDFYCVRSSSKKNAPAARHIGGIIGPY